MSEFKIQKSFLLFSLIALTAEHLSKKVTWNWWFREEFEILWKLDQFLSVVNSKQETGIHESDQGFGLGPWTTEGFVDPWTGIITVGKMILSLKSALNPPTTANQAFLEDVMNYRPLVLISPGHFQFKTDRIPMIQPPEGVPIRWVIPRLTVE